MSEASKAEMAEVGQNDAERWFERYLRSHGYEYEYEPDHGVSKRPDFAIERTGDRVVCEVKAFDEVTKLEKRLSETRQATMMSDDEVYGPMRSAVGRAARQLKPLAGSGLPLVVVLANPKGQLVHLEMERLVEAMFGNPVWRGRFNPADGRVDDMQFDYGRDGRLRNDHPYISAVAILRERAAASEYHDRWREEWKSGRPPLENPTYKDIVREFTEEQKAWDEHVAQAKIPEGDVHFLEVLTSGSPDAAEVPQSVFNGPRDTRVNVDRVSPRESHTRDS